MDKSIHEFLSPLNGRSGIELLIVAITLCALAGLGALCYVFKNRITWLKVAIGGGTAEKQPEVVEAHGKTQVEMSMYGRRGYIVLALALLMAASVLVFAWMALSSLNSKSLLETEAVRGLIRTYEKGRSAEEARDLPDAISIAKGEYAQYPSAELADLIANLDADSGNAKESMEWFATEETLRGGPTPLTAIGQAVGLIAEGSFDSARLKLDQAADLERKGPPDDSVKFMVETDYGKSYLEEAVTTQDKKAKDGLLVKATRRYEKAREYEAKASMKERAAFHANLGKLYLNLRMVALASKEFALEVSFEQKLLPDSYVHAQFNDAIATSSKGDYAVALSKFEVVYPEFLQRFDKNAGSALVLIADEYDNLNNPDEALFNNELALLLIELPDFRNEQVKLRATMHVAKLKAAGAHEPSPARLSREVALFPSRPIPQTVASLP